MAREGMDAAKAALLKHFIEKCKSNPSFLNDPSLGFFKDYLWSLGGQIPQNATPKSHTMDESSDNRANTEDHGYTKKPYKKQADEGSEDEVIESDIELDGEVVEPDNDLPQQMGDPSIEVSEESRDAAQMSKAKAVDALSEGKLVEAVEYLTEAIVLNPHSSILLATRASVFVKMNKPNAAIRDADAALQINPDSAKGYKYRGMARAMLGQWEEAARDLHIASNLDYDEDISSVLKKLEPNAHKIEEHRRKYERLRKEREMRKVERERQHRRTEAQTETAYEREKKEKSSESKSFSPESQDTESLAALQGGTVHSIHSSNELETKIKAASKLSRLVILYFTATWCGPCRFMSPLYTSLAGKFPEVVFLKVDIDQLGDVAHRWNVNSVPTFFFVRNGEEIDKVVGADKNGLEKKLALHAGQS